LRFLGGKADRYLKLVRHFGQSVGEDLAALDKHMASGNRLAAEGITHSIKGAASTLGLVALADIATHLDSCLKNEQALTEHGEFVRQNAADLNAAWTRLLAAMPSTQPEPEASVMDLAILGGVMNSLETLLEQNDTATLAYYEDNCTILRGALGRNLSVLEGQIKRFDFEAALASLRRERTRNG
jgi:HPt (histidine-containing phosphotransfer) domain-containing protein